ncbi:universal stress protein PHOS34-like [Nymphaea colorata]|nr:universal stress protein PHOS34-like [Nymphaea colorata]
MQKKVLLVGIDESHASFYSLEWAIDHLLAPDPPNSIFKLVLVHVKLPALSILRVSGPGIGGDILPTVEADLKKTAAVVTDKAKELCKRKSVINFHVEIVEGDARNALCQAVEKYHADILVVGSHGHGAFRRAILGSVSDYCAHHAHCTVMIVKKPKNKENHSN